jgi:hypothetical protein
MPLPGGTVPRDVQPTYRFGVTVLLQLDVRPHYAQVALVDATWQGYPQWETGDEQVVFRAESLTDSDNPPYPGFAVATRPDTGRDGPRTVRVEVWSDGEPAGLRCVCQSVLHVGGHGVLVGNEQSGSMTELALARGQYRLRVLVDAEATCDVSRVVFALSEPGITKHAPAADA